jgi:hypothetical protein
VPFHAWPLFRLCRTGDNRVKGGNVDVFFPPLLNRVNACFIKRLSATSFELKYIGNESGPFIHFTADIRYFSLQHHEVKPDPYNIMNNVYSANFCIIFVQF